MLQPLWRTGGACAALGLLLCTPTTAHALHDVSTAKTDDSNKDSWGQLQQMQSRVALPEEERGTLASSTIGDGDDADDEMMDGDSFRKLLHGCHGSPRCARYALWLHA